jgi:hypothetical protein
VALALGAAGAAVAFGRERSAVDAWLPTSSGTGRHGLAALHDWLEATGRRPLRLERPGDAPADAVILLSTGTARLPDGEAAAALARARAGGLLIWAAGAPGAQPALERRLDVSWGGAQPEPAAASASVADGLALATGPGAIASRMPGARPVGGAPAPAVSIPLGRGEVLLLAGPDAAENARLAAGDNLDLWVRAAARGPVAFVEGGVAGSAAPSRGALWLLGGQVLAASAALAWARGRRLGAVRPPPPAAAARTAADYVASLAVLYRRARADRALGEAAWHAHRLRLQRRAGVPARLDDASAERVLADRAPKAGAAFRRAAALAARGVSSPSELADLVRLSAAAEAAIDPRRRNR